jgi:hypothetical protein
MAIPTGPDNVLAIIVLIGLIVYGIYKLRHPGKTLDTPGAGVYVPVGKKRRKKR